MKRLGTVCVLLLGFLLIGITACSGGNKETTSQQPSEVDTNVTITANGNIEALSHKKLTFGSGGKVAQVAVKEGDMVSKGDILARLDTGALELAEAQAQANLLQAQVALNEVQVALTEAKLAEQTAEYNVEIARDLYTWSDIRIAQADVDETEEYIEYILEKLVKYVPPDEEGQYPDILEYILEKENPKLPGYEVWQERLVHAQARLNAAEDRLNAMLSGYDTKEVEIKKLQVKAAQQSVGVAEQNVNLAQHNVVLAQNSLIQARKDLEEATIIAPFDGTVARVGVKVGEFLSPAAYTGTTIIELIDPRHMELTARVDELDVVKVKTEQKVAISVDAMPETKLEGLVTFISPVAREPGAVLFEDEDEEKEYKVKVDFNIPENSPIRAGMSATAEIIVE